MHMTRMLPLLEVLVLNLFILDRCFDRRYSKLRTILVLSIFTFIFILSFLFLPVGAVDGRGRFSVLGFIYIIPLKYLYSEKWGLLLLDMCMSWTYTLGILAVSVHLAGFLSASNEILLVIIETLLFLSTFSFFYKHAIPQFSYIVKNTHSVQKHEFIYLKASIILNFLIFAILHAVLLDERRYLLQISVFILLLVANYLSYHIVYEEIRSSIEVNKLEKAVTRDALTGLGNRSQLLKDISLLMERGETFSIVFIDLDNFKLVNDRYGHDMGDRYLIHFGKVFSSGLEGNGRLYRHGGDEFVAIYDGLINKKILDSLTMCRDWEKDAPCEFYQASSGFVVCEPPYEEKDPNLMVKNADRIMYRNKEEKKAIPVQRWDGDDKKD